jgi:methionyl-tRNA formyltransferase
VRALHPHIVARVALADGTLLGVHRAAVLDDADAGAPAHAGATGGPAGGGRGVHSDAGRLLLDCSPGVLELLEVQPPGGRAMDAAAYLRGHGAPGRR